MRLKKNPTVIFFLKHIVVAILLIAVLVVFTFKWIKGYTHHGETYTVPALTGMSVMEAAENAVANKLRVDVVDSVYNAKFKPGVVVDQFPVANSVVKENRVVRLTVNSSEPEKVVLPKLTDVSFRQAQVLIEKYGLYVNSVSYKPSEYDNLVLKAMKDSILLLRGDEVIKGTGIDLVVGRSHGNEKTIVPNLIGFTLDEAKPVLTDSRLNAGSLIFDENIVSVEDSIGAKIWKQSPTSTRRKVEPGSSVDLWFTSDSTKIDKAYEGDY